MIRVAHVGNYKPQSANGVYQTIAGLVDHLHAAGVSVELWRPTSKALRVQKHRIGPIEVWDLPIYRSRLWNAIRLPHETNAALNALARNVDLIHLHSVFLPENVCIGKLGLSYVLTPHGGYDQQVIHGRSRTAKMLWMLAREKAHIRGAALIHAVSPHEEKYLSRMWPDRKVRFIPNAIALPSIVEPSRRPSERCLWGFLGRLAVEQKGLDLLFHGYAQAFPRDRNAGPELVLVGPDFRGGKAALQDLAHRLALHPSPRFKAPIFGDAKWKYLSETRVFLHTSRWEGMPFALLEAMAMGCPVLVTPETNVAEWIQERDAGWVTRGNAEEISAGLLAAAAAGADCLDQKGAQARRIVEECFTWPKVADQMTAEYRRILNA